MNQGHESFRERMPCYTSKHNITWLCIVWKTFLSMNVTDADLHKTFWQMHSGHAEDVVCFVLSWKTIIIGFALCQIKCYSQLLNCAVSFTVTALPFWFDTLCIITQHAVKIINACHRYFLCVVYLNAEINGTLFKSVLFSSQTTPEISNVTFKEDAHSHKFGNTLRDNTFHI